MMGINSTTLAYDFENRLISITYPSSATNTFTYNALGLRVGKVDSVGTFAYKRDGVEVTDPVLNDGAAQFTPGVSERRSGTTKFYHQNDLGTVSRVTNTSQSTTDTKQYDAFGLLVSSSGSTPTPFGFAGAWGYQEDADSGLKLLGHRYYDPSTGRFLTRDPIKDGRNWYGYCENKPLTHVDPAGTIPLHALLSISVPLFETHEDSWLDRVITIGGKGGRDKGRGEDPFYDKDEAELRYILKYGSQLEKGRARRVLKHKGKMNKRKRNEYWMPPIVPIPRPSIAPVPAPRWMPGVPIIIIPKSFQNEIWPGLGDNMG